jgi:hypothetical protein
MVATTSYRGTGSSSATRSPTWTRCAPTSRGLRRARARHHRGRVDGRPDRHDHGRARPGPYQGAVVFDATLYAKEPDMRWACRSSRGSRSSSWPPARGPGAEELPDGARRAPAPVVQPALFLISREGHTNINQAEHLEAFRALNAWIERGRDALPRSPNQAVLRRHGPARPRAVDGGAARRRPRLRHDGGRGRPRLRQRAPGGPGRRTSTPRGIQPMTFFELACAGAPTGPSTGAPTPT